MPDVRLVTSAEIEAAWERMAGKVHRTPMLASSAAARVVEAVAGARVADGVIYLKAEHLQKTGSYKPRGMVAKLSSLTVDERDRGVITISAGNAGQGYAYAGMVLGIPVTVVMPLAANPLKAAACRDYGAEVVLAGAHISETFAAMERLRDERGLTYCHPFNDPVVIAGQASVGVEILEDVPEVDVVIVPIGGGGLISGTAAAIGQGRPSARVVGVEPEGSDAMRQGLAAGHPVQISGHTIADGLNAPFAGEWNLAHVERYVSEIVLLDDATILSGLRFALERTKQVLEPAGAAGLAALLNGRVEIADGARVCVVLSGGNVDLTRLGDMLASAPVIAVP